MREMCIQHGDWYKIRLCNITVVIGYSSGQLGRTRPCPDFWPSACWGQHWELYAAHTHGSHSNPANNSKKLTVHHFDIIIVNT